MENLNYKNENIEKQYSNTWHDWLIYYMPESITSKIFGGLGEKKETKQTKST